MQVGRHKPISHLLRRSCNSLTLRFFTVWESSKFRLLFACQRQACCNSCVASQALAAVNSIASTNLNNDVGVFHGSPEALHAFLGRLVVANLHLRSAGYFRAIGRGKQAACNSHAAHLDVKSLSGSQVEAEPSAAPQHVRQPCPVRPAPCGAPGHARKGLAIILTSPAAGRVSCHFCHAALGALEHYSPCTSNPLCRSPFHRAQAFPRNKTQLGYPRNWAPSEVPQLQDRQKKLPNQGCEATATGPACEERRLSRGGRRRRPLCVAQDRLTPRHGSTLQAVRPVLPCSRGLPRRSAERSRSSAHLTK